MDEVTPASTVTLRPVTTDNLRAVADLEVAEHQQRMVATNVVSLAQAHFAGETAWYRAIYADETPVGFVMLSDKPRKPEYFLWRLMIDKRYQRMDFGRKAVELVIAYVKTRPQATELLVSYNPIEGNPGPFYGKLGFVETGEMEGNERIMRLSLSYEDGEAPAPPFGKPLVHVVLFKLKDVSDANVQRTIDKLRSLEGRVPTLRAIEVGSNVVAAERAYDIALIARFGDLAGMEAYQTHPYHQEVLAFMRTVMSSAVAVDYETDA